MSPENISPPMQQGYHISSLLSANTNAENKLNCQKEKNRLGKIASGRINRICPRLIVYRHKALS